MKIGAKMCESWFLPWIIFSQLHHAFNVCCRCLPICLQLKRKLLSLLSHIVLAERTLFFEDSGTYWRFPCYWAADSMEAFKLMFFIEHFGCCLVCAYACVCVCTCLKQVEICRICVCARVYALTMSSCVCELFIVHCVLAFYLGNRLKAHQHAYSFASRQPHTYTHTQNK